MRYEDLAAHFDTYKHVRFVNNSGENWVCVECVEIGIPQGNQSDPSLVYTGDAD